MKTYKIRLSFVLILSFVFSGLFAQEKINAPEKIRVGYINYANFIQKNADGTFSGYAVDYLNELRKNQNWEIEYVYDSWSNILKRIEEGSIDMVCQAQKTPEREEKFLFSKYSLGAESSILYTTLDNNNLYYNDFEAFNGMKVGLLTNSFQNEELAEYAKNHNFSYETVEFDTVDEGFVALDKGEIDAYGVGSLGTKTEYKIICRFGSDPFYIMANKKHQALINKMNDLLADVKAIKTSLETDLQKKYFYDISHSQISFTREESEYLKRSNEIVVGMIPNRPPFSSLSTHNNIRGITKDVMDLISQKTGLKFSYSVLKLGEYPNDYVLENPNSIVAGVLTDNPQFKFPDYIVSDAFYSEDIVVACLKTYDYTNNFVNDQSRIAIPLSYAALKNIVQERYPNAKIITGSTTEDCARLLINGEVDFLFQNMTVLKPLIMNPHFEDIVILPYGFMEEQNSVVGKKTSENRILMQIIDKAILSITEEERSKILIDNTANFGYKPNASDFIYKFRYPLMVIIILLVSVIIMTSLVFLLKKKHYQTLLESNRKLLVATKAAEKANSSKSQFLAQMSHEIRTPMNAIIGFTTICQKNIDNHEKALDCLGKILSSSKLLLGIINDILDMSAIETGKIKIDKSVFDLKYQITNITNLFYNQAKQKNVVFEVSLKGVTEELVLGDGLRLNQILMNLLSNAVKFTPSGGHIQLDVIQASHSDNKVRMRFVVSDTGCGMSNEMLSRLFKPFEQESASTARRYGGSGLGLSIARNLARLMDGDITVQSKEGEGSTFTADIVLETTEQKRDPENYDLSSVRTLIVDDDPDAREYCCSVLNRLKVPYQTADSGETALEMLGEAEDENKPFQLCIIDWKMPGMSGVELTKKIREIFGDDTIVIIVSAYDLNEIEAEGRENGANYFIAKPLFQSTVHDALVKILNKNDFLEPREVDTKGFDFKGKNVLIAEDVALNMEVAKSMLENVNLTVSCVEDGKEAVDIFVNSPEHTFDCILLDINMPVMDGYEAAKKIRASGKSDAKDIPIYAMTANAFTTDVTAALDSGMDGHISKPIEPEILYSTLKKAILENNEKD